MGQIPQEIDRQARAVTVIRSGALGDFVLTLPAIRALRNAFPEAELRLIGSPALARLALPDAIIDQDGPHLASLFSPSGEPPPLPTRRIFEHTDCCLAYSSAGDLLGGHLRQVVAGPVVVWDPRPEPSCRLHITEHLLAPLKQLGIGPVDAQPRIDIEGSQIRDDAEETLASDRHSPALVAVHPGSGGLHKCWPLECYINLIEELCLRQVAVVILLGPAETEVKLLKAIDGVRLVRPPGPWELASFLARTALFIGNDSGPGHVAAAVGTPTLSLFGPTDPLRWSPVGPQCHVIRAPDGNLRILSVDAVLSAALRALERE